MNFKAIKRAEELRLNIENQDNEIIELEKVMYSLAIQDGQGLTLSLSVSLPPVTPNPGTDQKYKSGGYPPIRSIPTEFGSMSVFEMPSSGSFNGIFEAIRGVTENENRERIDRKAPSRSSFVITNDMALEFLAIYHKKLIDQRALTFKLLEECIKTLKVLD